MDVLMDGSTSKNGHVCLGKGALCLLVHKVDMESAKHIEQGYLVDRPIRCAREATGDWPLAA